MRVVFMGTPSFAVPSLRRLAEAYEVCLVVTRPDAVRGRGRKLVPSAVKEAASDLGIEVVCATRVDDELCALIEGLHPDVICVAAYGAILPDRLIAAAPLGCINVHASLLPRWRGAAPIQRAILAEDEEIGVSIMEIAHELDAGAYCRQASVPTAEMGADECTEVLATLGATELVAALAEIEAGTVAWHEQDEALVTFAPKVTKAEMALSPEFSAHELCLRVRASNDAAPARAKVLGRGMRVVSAREAELPVAAGAVAIEGRRVYLGCSSGSLELVEVRPDGKREMAASAWLQGVRLVDATWERA